MAQTFPYAAIASSRWPSQGKKEHTYKLATRKLAVSSRGLVDTTPKPRATGTSCCSSPAWRLKTQELEIAVMMTGEFNASPETAGAPPSLVQMTELL